jgi:hypothetical protein
LQGKKVFVYLHSVLKHIVFKTTNDILIQDLKITNNEQKNVSTIEKKEKK